LDSLGIFNYAHIFLMALTKQHCLRDFSPAIRREVDDSAARKR
jgi:hypothetical protein